MFQEYLKKPEQKEFYLADSCRCVKCVPKDSNMTLTRYEALPSRHAPLRAHKPSKSSKKKGNPPVDPPESIPASRSEMQLQ